MDILLLLTLSLISIAGLAEIAPLFAQQSTTDNSSALRLSTPLELLGRQIYIREGCFNCHSQIIRPIRDEAERYGSFDLAEESVHDDAFTWGSKRAGLDLARVGDRYSDEWHVVHLTDPRSVQPESTMPAYGYLATTPLDYRTVQNDLKVSRDLGIGYTDEQIANAGTDLVAQANTDHVGVISLKRRYGKSTPARDFDGNPNQISEMDALVAYLQSLGIQVDEIDADRGGSPNRR